MSIEDRNLKPGTRLVARYKGQEHTAQVVETEEGLRYRREDGRELKSPSSAGSAVMEGKACNGWRFWSLARKKPRTKRAQATFERLEDGRRFCSTCMDAFEVADDQEPAECPQGHKAAGEGT